MNLGFGNHWNASINQAFSELCLLVYEAYMDFLK